MDTQKFTEKSLSAMENAHNDAVRRKNSELSTVHLLSSLTFQENGLVPGFSKKWRSILKNLHRLWNHL